MEYTIVESQLNEIETLIEKQIIGMGVQCVCLIDLAGNVIANLDNGSRSYDVYALAALAAGNFGAISAIAKIIGEEEFSLLFHKGKKASIHFNKVLADFLLVIIFDNNTSLGFVRLKVDEVSKKIAEILTP